MFMANEGALKMIEETYIPCVSFLDRNPELKALISPFLEDGYRKMYL